MIREGSAVQVLRLHEDMYGNIRESEYVFGRVAEINELYSPPILVEVIFPSKTQEQPCFYRFWTDYGNIKNSVVPAVASDIVNPFGY